MKKKLRIEAEKANFYEILTGTNKGYTFQEHTMVWHNWLILCTALSIGLAPLFMGVEFDYVWHYFMWYGLMISIIIIWVKMGIIGSWITLKNHTSR